MIGSKSTTNGKGGVVLIDNKLVCSRPDSAVWQIVPPLTQQIGLTSQFKSKKIQALSFGQLIDVGHHVVLSISDSHLVLLHISHNKILDHQVLLSPNVSVYDRGQQLVHVFQQTEQGL